MKKVFMIAILLALNVSGKATAQHRGGIGRGRVGGGYSVGVVRGRGYVPYRGYNRYPYVRNYGYSYPSYGYYSYPSVYPYYGYYDSYNVVPVPVRDPLFPYLRSLGWPYGY